MITPELAGLIFFNTLKQIFKLHARLHSLHRKPSEAAMAQAFGMATEATLDLGKAL
ncbi:MAG: hypothetical protein ACO3V7_01210 [Burkholderiaceae bacterium]